MVARRRSPGCQPLQKAECADLQRHRRRRIGRCVSFLRKVRGRSTRLRASYLFPHTGFELFLLTDLSRCYPAWTKLYPPGKPDVTKMPQEWIEALANAVSAGLIPNITLSNEGNYGSGVNASSVEICSSTDQCRGDGDIWDAPDGMLGVSFDDVRVYSFLICVERNSTHGASVTDGLRLGQLSRDQRSTVRSSTNSSQPTTSRRLTSSSASRFSASPLMPRLPSKTAMTLPCTLGLVRYLCAQ